MPYYPRPHRKKAPEGPDRYYHGTVERITAGTAAGGRKWWLVVVRPDYYWVEGNVMRDVPPRIKWFESNYPNASNGKEIFLSGKYKEASAIPPLADVLANVNVLDKDSFARTTGYPEGKREGGPAPLPPPPQAPKQPVPVPGKNPLPPPPQDKQVFDLLNPRRPENPCVKKVTELMAKMDEALKDIEEAKGRLSAELEAVVPGAGKLFAGAGPNLVSRAEDVLRTLEDESQPDDSAAMTVAFKELPEVPVQTNATVSPREFLDIGKALMEHALAAIDLAAEDPTSTGNMDLGDVSVPIEDSEGLGNQRMESMKPMFGPQDMSRGIDHIEQNFIVPLQSEMARAEREAAQEIPEFVHNLPFVPKTLKRSRTRTEMIPLVRKTWEDARIEMDRAQDAMDSLPGFIEITRIGKEYDEDMRKLDLMRWDCQSETTRIADWKRGKPVQISVTSPGGRWSSTWVSRNCRFAQLPSVRNKILSAKEGDVLKVFREIGHDPVPKYLDYLIKKTGEGDWYIAPNDGRVPTGQRVSEDTLLGLDLKDESELPGNFRGR